MTPIPDQRRLTLRLAEQTGKLQARRRPARDPHEVVGPLDPHVDAGGILDAERRGGSRAQGKLVQRKPHVGSAQHDGGQQASPRRGAATRGPAPVHGPSPGSPRPPPCPWDSPLRGKGQRIVIVEVVRSFRTTTAPGHGVTHGSGASGREPRGLSPSTDYVTFYAMQENPLMAGLGLPREPRPLTLVIFGASGDLTRRKLFPALFSLYLKGSIPGVRIVGFARRDWDTAKFRALVREWLDSDDASGGLRQRK